MFAWWIMQMPLMVLRPAGRRAMVARFNGDVDDLRLALVRVRAVKAKTPQELDSNSLLYS